jgi:hypothetical protein
MKKSIFWNVTPCSQNFTDVSKKRNVSFPQLFRHLKTLKTEAALSCVTSVSVYLHGVTSQKTLLFIIAAVIT